MSDFVLDACVLLDMLLSARPRHSKARDLADALTAQRARAYAPATVLVEMFAATAQEFAQRGVAMSTGRPYGAVWPFDFFTFSIDQDFVTEFVAPHRLGRWTQCRRAVICRICSSRSRIAFR